MYGSKNKIYVPIQLRRSCLLSSLDESTGKPMPKHENLFQSGNRADPPDKNIKQTINKNISKFQVYNKVGDNGQTGKLQGEESPGQNFTWDK